MATSPGNTILLLVALVDATLVVGLLLGTITYRPVLGPAAVIAVLPVGNLTLPELPGGPSVVSLVATLVCVVGAAALVRRHWLEYDPLLVAGALLVATALLATIGAPDPGAALRLGLLAISGFGLTVILVSAARRTGEIKGLLMVFLAAAAVLLAVSLLQGVDLKASNGGAAVANQVTGVFAQPNELGCFAAISGCVSVAFAFAVSRWQNRLVAIAVAALSVTALGLSMSRGAWLGFACGIVVVLVLVRASRVPVLTTAAALMGIGVLVGRDVPIIGLLMERLGTMGDIRATQSDGRPTGWSAALQQIVERPTAGPGPGGFRTLAAGTPSALPVDVAERVHSMPLAIAAGPGLLGLAAVVVLVVVGVLVTRRAARRAVDGPARALVAAPAAGLAAVLGQGMIDDPLRNPVLAISVWLFIGLLAAVHRTSTLRRRSGDLS